MPLKPGTKLGPYEILSPLGAGGMGEVYRARDTRLGRDVAIKVLPQHLSAQPEVRSRFEREAKTVSSLNHPNICTLFDVGREGDTDYLVMELIEGETLAARLTKGALPLADVLRLGSQVADALDRAHRAGVVHRDLKPGNIMLTKSGAKLMDFGLARATGMAGPGSGSGVTMAALTQSPTIAQPLTAEGTIVGTFQYMAPEQLEGKEADARSDLWAFGCVLYEMATGKRAFEGQSQASLIGAIMHAEPAPISQVAPLAPPELERLVRACLVKDPADRLQSAHDMKLQLAWLADGATSLSGTRPAVPVAAKRARPNYIAFAAVAVAAAALATVVTLFMHRGGNVPVATRVPERYVLTSAQLAANSAPVLSPDGSYVVFALNDNGERHLGRRNITSFDITPIAGTEDAIAPFFSRDGAWIGFCTSGAIKKIPTSGGVAQVVVSEPAVDSADWGSDGMIYYCQRDGGAERAVLKRVPDTGGAPFVVAALDTSVRESEGWLPEILPDGKTVLLTVAGGKSAYHIDAVRPDGTRVGIVENALLSRYVSGFLIYQDMGSEAVLCAPFDTGTLEITGAAVPLTEAADPSYSFDVRGRTLVYVPPAGAGEGRELVWTSRTGSTSLMMDTRSSWTQPRVSPDGKRILVRKVLNDCELWTYDIERGALARVVQGTDNHDPVWSPDGRSIAYLENDTGRMVVRSVQGASELTVVPLHNERGRPRSWSQGGNRLVFTMIGRGTQSDIWTCKMDPPLKPEPFLATEFNERNPAISTDGKYIAYVSNEGGGTDVFVRPFPATGEVWQVSVGGGGSPLWSRDGKELFFVVDTKMMSVPVQMEPSFHVGRPVELFTGGFNTDRSRDFDVAPDGRFVMVRVPGGSAGQHEVRVLLNWPEEYRRVRGPAAK